MNTLPIFEAAFKNDPVLIRKLVKEEGLDPSLPHPGAGHTPLQLACEADSIEAIATLLELGVDPNQKFTKVSKVDGREILKDATALSCVVSAEAAALLINAGAQIDVIDGLGMTPLVRAATQRYISVFEYLLAKGANVTMEINFDRKGGKLLALMKEKLAFSKQTFGNTPNKNQKAYLDDIGLIISRLESLS